MNNNEVRVRQHSLVILDNFNRRGYLTRLRHAYELILTQNDLELSKRFHDLVEANGCTADNGDRTNYKLRTQPYYQRNRNGKMRGY